MKLIKRLSIDQKEYVILIEDKEKEEDRINNDSNSNRIKILSPPKNNAKNKVIQNEIKRSSSQSLEKKDQQSPKNQSNINFMMKRQTSTPFIPPPLENEEKDTIKEGDLAGLNDVDEKVHFKSFKIIKVLGSGAFGKVFMVSFLTFK